jgi:hypothetical protein
MLSVYAECLYAECLYAVCHYAVCHYAECHYAECRVAIYLCLKTQVFKTVMSLSPRVKTTNIFRSVK